MTEVRWPGVLTLGTFGAFLWGAHARLWMRFITADPEFTWSGTLFIVGAFTAAGLVQAFVFLARRRGLSRRLLTPVRIIGFVSLAPLAVGAGSALFPVIVFGALAFGQTQWSTRLRAIMIALAGLSFGGLFVVLLEDLSVIRAVVGTVWAIGLYALIARAAVPTFGAQRDGWRTPRWLFYPVLVMGVVSMLISVPLLVGQSG